MDAHADHKRPTRSQGGGSFPPCDFTCGVLSALLPKALVVLHGRMPRAGAALRPRREQVGRILLMLPVHMRPVEVILANDLAAVEGLTNGAHGNKKSNAERDKMNNGEQRKHGWFSLLRAPDGVEYVTLEITNATQRTGKVAETWDVYSGWIVARVDGFWRHVYVQDGFVALADFYAPNAHVGVFRTSDLAGDVTGPDHSIEGETISTSRHAFVAGLVVERDILDRVDHVRFGRVAQIGKNPHGVELFDAPPEAMILRHKIRLDHDDGCAPKPAS